MLVLGTILAYVPGNEIPAVPKVTVADKPRPTKDAFVCCTVVTVPKAEVND